MIVSLTSHALFGVLKNLHFVPSTPKSVSRYFFKKFYSQARFRKPAFFASENAVVDLLTGSNLHFCLVLNPFFLGYKISL